MSGEKRTFVRVDQNEYRQLQEAAKRNRNMAAYNASLRASNAQLQASLTDVSNRNNALQQNLQTMTRNIAAVQASANQQTQALRDQLQRAITQSNARLEAQARQYNDQLQQQNQAFNDALNATRAQVAGAMAENNRRLEQTIRDNTSQLQSQIDGVRTEVSGVKRDLQDLQATVSGIQAGNDTLLEMAETLAEYAQFLNEDSAKYNCDVLLPGQFAAVQNAFRQAQDSIQLAHKIPNNSAVARRDAQSAYQDALLFHEQIIRAYQAWNLQQQATRQALAEAEAQLAASQEVTPENETYTVDVDHWSCGDLQNLSRRLSGLGQEMANCGNHSVEDLQNIQEAGEQIVRECEDTVAFAVAAINSSQDRADIAQEFADTMCARFGLNMARGEYQGQDARGAHRLLLKNPVTGFEMVVTQTPRVDTDGAIGHELEVDVISTGNLPFDATATLACDIQNVLQGMGLHTNGVQTVPGFETRCSNNHEAANLNEWQQQTATTQVKRPAVAATASAGKTPAAKPAGK